VGDIGRDAIAIPHAVALGGNSNNRQDKIDQTDYPNDNRLAIRYCCKTKTHIAPLTISKNYPLPNRLSTPDISQHEWGIRNA
jgi:hypothetical protein